MPFVKRVFKRLVGQAVPLLKAVPAQPPRGTDRLAVDPAARRLQRPDDGEPLRLRDDALRLAKNFFHRVPFFFIAYPVPAALR